MQRPLPPNSFILQNFQEFYKELLVQKELALTFDQELEVEGESSEINEKKELLPGKIQRRLRLLLEQQSLNAASQVGEFAVSHYQEAQYVMAALADEIFLNIKWHGQKYWENSLLESHLFHTQIAGELFFTKLEAVLTSNDPTQLDLAIIYLWTLGLGFKGQYRDQHHEEKLDWYRNQLYVLITHHSSNLFHPGRAFLDENCYEHRVTQPTSRGLPELRLWLIAFSSIVLIYLFASSVFWYKIARDMDDTTSLILQQARYMGLS